MRKYSKILSAFLAVMLLITAFGTTAFADEGTTTLTTTVPCTVTLQIGERGAVTAAGTKYTGNASFQAALNTVLTYTISPDSGYKISKVTYDGTDVTEAAKSGTYTAAALQGNVTLTVTFVKKTITPTDPTSPKTGDESHMALWIGLMCVSGAGLGMLLISRRKRRAN